MPKLASLVESKLPAEKVEMLKAVGELAATGQTGASEAYLVGGSVRDLILGRTPNDPDISVVGNGSRFAAAPPTRWRWGGRDLLRRDEARVANVPGRRVGELPNSAGRSTLRRRQAETGGAAHGGRLPVVLDIAP